MAPRARAWRIRARLSPSYVGGPFCATSRGWMLACGAVVRLHVPPRPPGADAPVGSEEGATKANAMELAPPGEERNAWEEVDGSAVTALWTDRADGTVMASGRPGTAP
eukprot:jgi/Pico_ML_1/53865/g4335.t1